MKKILFPGLAALLMLAFFSCEVEEQSGGGVTLNVTESSGARALDGPIAEVLTSFYEAAFEKVPGGRIIRATWNYAQKGKIQIDPGDYKVILLAGRNADKTLTLLGVGQATGIGGGGLISTYDENPLQVTITAATTDLYFHAYPLMNDINDTPNSTFKTTSTLPLDTATDTFGNVIPVFMINQGVATTATWKFGMGDLPGVAFFPSDPFTGVGKHGDPGYGDQIDVFGPNIRVAGAAVVSQTGFSYPTTPLADPKITGLTAGVSTITGTFNMSFTAPNAAGKVQIALNVPVVAFANSDNPVIWNIRGGLDNGLIDAGKGPSAGAIGGAIVLGF
jgi:hypothetical protein